VMVASSGSPLLEADAVDAYRSQLFALATLITPNLHEAQNLLGRDIDSLESLEVAATDLSKEFSTAILLKGGHLDSESCVDVLAEGETLTRFTHPRLPDADTHGTGCSLAAAIAAGLAKGLPLAQAVGQATDYIATALASRYRFDHPEGIEALNQGTLPEPFGNGIR
jgi:hydroxymethylpyrimidine/phosphomethylpyrimidine kinase